MPDVADDGFASSLPARVQLKSAAGVFVLSEAAANNADAKPGMLAWWKDADTGQMSIFGRLIHTQEDVGHALLSLERDVEADLQPLTAGNATIHRALMIAADSNTDDPTDWQPASYALALSVMGFDPPDAAEAAEVDARLFTPKIISPLFCPSFLKAINTNTESSKPISGPLKAVYKILAITECDSGGHHSGDPPPCPGDIDCDGIPDADDPDIDGDGIPNISDPDVDGDGILNGDDPDVDGDGILNGDDPDVDGDGLGNGSDSDVDGDGASNANDPDIDGDGSPNSSDNDDDGDGSPDPDDPSPGGCTTDCSGACCNTTAGTCTLKSMSACTGANEQFKGFQVVCNPNPCCPFGNNPTFPPSSATLSFLNLGIPPNPPPDLWGETGTDSLSVSIDATCDGTQWCAVLNGLSGVYTEWYRLLPGVSEVTGPPPGNTTQQNNCNQLRGLNIFDQSIQQSSVVGWFMLQAVHAHEDAHAAHLLPALQNKTAEIETLIEAVCVPYSPGMTKTDAISMILSTPAYDTAVYKNAIKAWSKEYGILAANDDGPNGANEQAEGPVVYPMIANICDFNKSQCWPVCSDCPTRLTGACCAPDTGVCNVKTKCDCEAGGGMYTFDDTTCSSPNPCKGACCAPDFTCTETTFLRCISLFDGNFSGNGTTCATSGCGPGQ